MRSKSALKTWCYEWFNATSRNDWNGLTVAGIQADIADLDGVPGTAEEIFAIMTEIVAEYDELNVTPDEPATDLQTVGANIRKAREASGLNQTQLASLVGTTQSIIGRYERGEVDPGVTRVIQIIRALGCQPSDIL